MSTLVFLLDRFNRQTTRWAGHAATLLLAAMLVVMIVHVVYRYALGDSFGWTEELSRYMMVWMAFLYFPAAHKKGLNASLDLCTEWFRGSRPWQLLQLLIEAAILASLIWCIQLGFDRIERGATTQSLALGIPMAQVYYILPISFALTALCSLERLLRSAHALFCPREAAQLTARDRAPDNRQAEL
ncbi:TRAP transporter small permease [Halomonas elongata]|uniref:TRAP transporter small permease n=1 Tax=Halomonas elongata TaxID=2746 RepID=UPI00186BA9F2|nr:TRAP transporter small permease [Halomonas elongata]MBW5799729.1 TRAP transporter small permease [Halomonas elongata]MDL4864284.1 TRAP transporter small permease [Halomonas elongata]